MGPRFPVLLGAVAGGCLLGSTATVVLSRSPDQAAAERRSPTLPPATATVIEQRLRTTMSAECSAQSWSLEVTAPRLGPGRPDVVTRLGRRTGPVRTGDLLVEVSGRSVLAVVTKVPFYRDLAAGDVGADVEHLERALVTRGVLGSADRSFTADTARALDTLARRAGVAPSGRFVLHGAAGVRPGSVVAEVLASVGDQVKPGTTLVRVTASTRTASCRAPSAAVPVPAGTRLVLNSAGRRIPVVVTTSSRLRDGSGMQLTVRSTAGRTPAPLASGQISIVVDQTETPVLTIPAAALRTTPDGGLQVRARTEDGVMDVPVTTGRSSSGWIEVTGPGLRSGQVVELTATPEADPAGAAR